jgi:hypothetical protein
MEIKHMCNSSVRAHHLLYVHIIYCDESCDWVLRIVLYIWDQ